MELRLRRLPAQQQAIEADDADKQGYVLIRPLLAALAKFERSTPAMSLYFPELVGSIDAAAEVKRVQALAFEREPSSAAPPRTVGPTAGTQAKLGAEGEAALAEGQRLIAIQDAAGAAAAFERVLKIVPGQARALYGLAVASVLQGNAAGARELFEQVVHTATTPADAATRPDSDALAWSHIYLGRMDDLDGDREEALDEYRAALAVADAPEASRTAAQRGLEQEYQPVGRGPASR